MSMVGCANCATQAQMIAMLQQQMATQTQMIAMLQQQLAAASDRAGRRCGRAAGGSGDGGCTWHPGGGSGRWASAGQ